MFPNKGVASDFRKPGPQNVSDAHNSQFEAKSVLLAAFHPVNSASERTKAQKPETPETTILVPE